MVENHCKALLSDVYERPKDCKAIGNPPKVIMAQNTGKRYSTPKSHNHDDKYM